ncbi:MAG: polysaccharide deacetylase family protein [Bacteroidales bacterium]|nr:polysaccharide deacetylase family protein [Bacteroidales bacterium]
MIITKTPWLLKRIYYSLFWDLKNGQKEVFLTFDDGPNRDVTPAVLEILDQFEAKATFFCIGRNVERYPDVFETIKDKGHATGNHTYSHLKGWIHSNTEYYKDIELADRLIHSRLFRPPYGKIKRSQLKYLRQFYSIIMWDVMSNDYDRTVSPDKCIENVINHARPGSIIVFHDSEKSSERTLAALPGILEILKTRGYTFSTIPDTISSRSDISQRRFLNSVSFKIL